MVTRGRRFSEQEIHLDGNEFLDCNFERCTLIYSGSEPVTIGGCTFDKCNLSFIGPAKLTLSFLTSLYHGGFRDLIEATFKNIREGKHPQK